MIKYIVDTFFSRTNQSGNRYWMARITSTKTGRQAWFGTPSGDNFLHFLRKHSLEWSEFHSTEQGLPIREWNQMEKYQNPASYSFCDEEPEAWKVIKALNRAGGEV